MERVDQDFVRAFFEREGYQLLSDYKRVDDPVKFRCPENHEHQIPFRRFRDGKRCKFCMEAKRIHPQKLTQSFVEAQLELSGYKMLSDYINARTNFDFQCPKNHLGKMCWGSFQSGARCKDCAYIDNGKKKKIEANTVKDIFQEQGYEILEEYVGARSPIKFRCPSGHLGQIALYSFKKGTRCIECWKLRQGPEKILEPSFVIEYFNLQGYEVLGEYKGCDKKMNVICPNKHQWAMTWSSFRSGKRCELCARKKRANTQRLSQEFIEKQFALEGYEVIGQYVNSGEPLKFRCPQNHEAFISWDKFKMGRRCGVCHTQNFYKVYVNYPVSRIICSLKREIERQKFSTEWEYFYLEEQIKAIAEQIAPAYNSCPHGYQVDHLVPVSWFNLLREDELKACWNPLNLRHLASTTNNKRGNRMTSDEIDFMKANHPEIFYAASRNPHLAKKTRKPPLIPSERQLKLALFI